MAVRASGREPDELRTVRFTRDYTEMAAGACLVTFGRTRVLCTASIDEDVPRWMRGSGKGWVTAEYSMLPGSSPERIDREAARGKQSGRTVEIQRLIGRSLRAACDMTLLGATLPFFLRKIGADPASASAPFVATLSDVTGLVIYFTLANLILSDTIL